MLYYKYVYNGAIVNNTTGFLNISYAIFSVSDALL